MIKTEKIIELLTFMLVYELSFYETPELGKCFLKTLVKKFRQFRSEKIFVVRIFLWYDASPVELIKTIKKSEEGSRWEETKAGVNPRNRVKYGLK